MGCPLLLSKLQHKLIDIAPAPVLAGLVGHDNRVIGRVKMFGRVRVLRRVAAADMSTREAKAQMHPGISCLQAVFAAVRAGRDLLYLVQMGAGFCHKLFLRVTMCCYLETPILLHYYMPLHYMLLVLFAVWERQLIL
jgi:hypothetical protein